MRIMMLASIIISIACTSPYQKRGIEVGLPPYELDAFVGTSPEARMRQINVEARSIERFEDFTIGIIEFDDNGNVNPAQRDMVIGMVRDELSNQDTLLVNFIHGWHHGARVCDRDLACFRRVLQELSTLNGRKVVGVFFGWRGESCAWPGINLATIWDRKSVAQHIGNTGAKEVLVQIHAEYVSARKRNPGTVMVSVGHSFGGAMLFSAVKGRLTGNISDISRPKLGSYRVVRAVEDREVAEREGRKALRAGFGDLVVLVNPAIEARQYAPFAADLPNRTNPRLSEELIARKLPYDANRPYTEGQLPVLMTIASSADTAVGVLFPASAWLSAIPTGRFYQFGSQGSRGMGRYEPHVTHTLGHPVVGRSSERAVTSRDCDCTKSYGRMAEQLRGEVDLNLATVEPQTFGQLNFSLATQREGNWDPFTPYLVIRAEAGVIGEHSDIFNPVFVGFLARYIRAIEVARAEAATPDQVR